MKRLLFFMHTSSVTGGVETWLDYTYEYLSKSGFNPIVGLVRGQKYNLPERYKAEHPQLQTVEVDGRGLNREGRVRALMRCIRRVRPNIVMPLGIFDANEAVVRCKQRGDDIRLVIHAQGNLEPMLADLALYRDWIDQVVCPGRLTTRVLTYWAGFSPERVKHIPNGADEPIHNRTERADDQPLRLGYVGRLTHNDKRALDLIVLYRELEKLNIAYTLDIVGEGPCCAELKLALGSLEPKIKLHGSLQHEKIYEQIFPNLDLLVLLSSSEAFGIVLAEAMIHGVVPVTSQYIGFRSERLVIEEVTGLSFPVGDMTTAAKSIDRLTDLNLFHQLSHQAQIHAKQYTWENTLRAWGQILHEVANRLPIHGNNFPLVLDDNNSSRLSRWGVPATVADTVRRIRRMVLGPAVPPGGEEWPLFHRNHPESTLVQIGCVSQRLDTAEIYDFVDLSSA